MTKLIYLLITLFFVFSCTSDNFETISYEKWGNSVTHLISQKENSETSQINSLLKEISKADFLKLKNAVKMNNIEDEFFIINVYDGEVVTEELIYVVENKSNTYKTNITLQLGEKKFRESSSRNKINFKDLIENKSGRDVYYDSIIITKKDRDKIISYFVYTTDDLLDFL